MRRSFLIPIVGLIVGAIVLWHVKSRATPSDSIEYQGQTIRLRKAYGDYDEYKNDPNNLAPTEVARVQALVQAAPIGKRFGDRRQMQDAVFKLRFPGYGLGSYGEKTLADGSVQHLFGVEIPQSGNMRYFLFRGVAGTYTLIDDFVYADAAGIRSVTISGDKLIYSTREGKSVVERSPLPP